LRVFLEYPDVPIDTNHLEREIRPIALGRRYDYPRIMRSSLTANCPTKAEIAA
jgi:hypothetical protein